MLALMISPFPLATSSDQRKKRKQHYQSVLLTSHPYVNKVKERTSGRQEHELGRSAIKVCKGMQLNSEYMFQENIDD
jgi:hypothetical protein